MKPLRILFAFSFLPSITVTSEDLPNASEPSKWSLSKKIVLGLGILGLTGASYYALRHALFATAEEQLFGYPLDIEYLEENNKQVTVVDKHPTLFLHGWGGSKRDATVLKYEYQTLPGTVIAFNFPDAHGFLSIIAKTNFGQLNDVLAALYVLKQVKDTQSPNAVDLFGHSRGGAVAINMVHVLADTSCTYDEALKKIGITPIDRKELLQLILNGSITLDCPLIDANSALKKQVGSGFKNWLVTNLVRFGGYNPEGMQPINTIKTLYQLPLHIMYHGQIYDEVIGHEKEDEFCLLIAQLFPETSSFIRGSDGGHNHKHTTLARTIHALRTLKSHNSVLAQSYTPTQNRVGTIFKASNVATFCKTKELQRTSRVFPQI